MSLRIAEHAERTDPGRARRGNEDSFWIGPPAFVVADGMGGAQAGEVASRIAVETFSAEIGADGPPEHRLAGAVRTANARIAETARTHRERAGMGTTLIAALVGPQDVALAHVGDSRIYRLRDEALTMLTRDHTLVQALIDQGRLSEEEAAVHPQRSVITRALGAEHEVEVDTRTLPARDGDVFLLCSDGLTSMVDEDTIARILVGAGSLAEASAALVDAANAAGGRDNITVVLFRLEEDGEDGEGAAAGPPTEAAEAGPPPADHTQVFSAAPAAPPRSDVAARPGARRRRSRRVTVLRRGAITVLIVAPVLVGLWVATRLVYFVGTDSHGLVAVYRGVPYDLPAGIRLYERFYVSGVPASIVPPGRRRTLLDHSLRSERDASDLVDQLELGRVAR